MGKTIRWGSRIAVVDGWLRLNLALRQISTIHEKNLILESIVSGFRETPREASKEENHLNQWVQDRLRGALDRLEVVEEQDGRAFIPLARSTAETLS